MSSVDENAAPQLTLRLFSTVDDIFAKVTLCALDGM
jgi:hypothetical protein